MACKLQPELFGCLRPRFFAWARRRAAFRSDVLREIAGLNERQQAELVVLLWAGCGDAEPEEWEKTVEMARGRKETPTPRYLLDDPLLSEYWLEGAARLGVDLTLAETSPLP